MQVLHIIYKLIVQSLQTTKMILFPDQRVISETSNAWLRYRDVQNTMITRINLTG